MVAAAVILPKAMNTLAKAGLTDSKQLTRDERERLDKKIRRIAVSISVVEIDAETIDRVKHLPGHAPCHAAGSHGAEL